MQLSSLRVRLVLVGQVQSRRSIVGAWNRFTGRTVVGRCLFDDLESGYFISDPDLVNYGHTGYDPAEYGIPAV